MSISSLTVEKLNYLIAKSGHLHQTLSIVAEIPLPTLVRKLAGEGDFTVGELAGITRALGTTMSALFAPGTIKEDKPCTVPACVRSTHQYENGYRVDYCRLARIEDEGFNVNGHLDEKDEWAAWVDPDDIADGWAGIAQVRKLLTAFEQMQRACDALNGHAIERRTAPGQPAAEELQGVGL
ncbi:hypothetical protein [Leucobacter chromiireducens]|uniref:HTH cro/C1-type domain-containing protein n=1 Tax=Leucobacter chromiireducens subsp. chromiireducens TaxID=660067 RepID=A0ABS1SLB6_9MICO|nr:hypothetical protein [Leucobacter chromiireducens]MBL3688950.1 hypothetical protein [Leucobacter chromiireducens subsp. chromiireducens]